MTAGNEGGAAEGVDTKEKDDGEEGAASAVKAEVAELRDLAGGYASVEVTDGTWFPKFLRYALTQYSSKVNAA